MTGKNKYSYYVEKSALEVRGSGPESSFRPLLLCWSIPAIPFLSKFTFA